MGTANAFRASLAGRALDSGERCFTIFKPDAIEKGLEKELCSRIAALGLHIVVQQRRLLVPDEVCTIWPQIIHPHVSRTVPYMTSRPVVLGLVAGENASDQMLELKRTIRAEHPSDNPVVSVIHTTSDNEELWRCVEHFFGGEQHE